MESKCNTCKTTLNHWQRRFRNRNTIQNKNALIEAENQFEKANLNAMDNWSHSLNEKFDNTCDPKDRCTIYTQITKKKT